MIPLNLGPTESWQVAGTQVRTDQCIITAFDALVGTPQKKNISKERFHEQILTCTYLLYDPEKVSQMIQ